MSAPRLGWEPIPSRETPGWLQQQRGPGGHSQGVIWVLGEAEAAPAPLRTDLGAGWLLLGGWHLVFGSHPQPGRLLLREESSDIKIATEDTPGTEPMALGPCPMPAPRTHCC